MAGRRRSHRRAQRGGWRPRPLDPSGIGVRSLSSPASLDRSAGLHGHDGASPVGRVQRREVRRHHRAAGSGVHAHRAIQQPLARERAHRDRDVSLSRSRLRVAGPDERPWRQVTSRGSVRRRGTRLPDRRERAPRPRSRCWAVVHAGLPAAFSTLGMQRAGTTWMTGRSGPGGHGPRPHGHRPRVGPSRRQGQLQRVRRLTSSGGLHHSTGRPRPRAISIRWTSDVPSPISSTFASR